MLAYFLKKKTKWILKSFICNQMEVATLIFLILFFFGFLAAGELGPSCSCCKKREKMNARKW